MIIMRLTFLLLILCSLLSISSGNSKDLKISEGKESLFLPDESKSMNARSTNMKRRKKKQKKQKKNNKKKNVKRKKQRKLLRKSMKKSKKRFNKNGKNVKSKKLRKQKGQNRMKMKNMLDSRNQSCFNSAKKKAKAWIASNINAKKIYNNIFSKESNSKSETTLEMFNKAADLLRDVTDNGTSCKGGDPDSEVNDALEILANCKDTALASCSPLPDFDLAASEKCIEELENVTTQCVKGDSACCKFPSEEQKKCNIGNKTSEMRELLYKNCLNKTLAGSFRNCMTKVKESPKLALKCLKLSNGDCPTSTTSASESTSTSPNVPVTTKAPAKTIDTTETFVENGVVYQQKIRYDPDSKEAVITVPAHGDRIAVSVVVGEEKTVVVSESTCIVEETPDDLDVSEFANNKTDDNGTVTPSKPKVYKIYTDLGEMTEEEIENLSEGVKSACEGKSIHKTKIEEVDESMFNQLKSSEEITSSTRVNHEKFRNTCSNLTVSNFS